MKMKKTLKKAMSLMLAMTLAIPSTIPTFGATGDGDNVHGGANVGDTVNVFTKGGAWYSYGTNGTVFSSKLDAVNLVMHNGEPYDAFAYCIDPTKPGVSSVGNYDVVLSDFSDEKLNGIIYKGYPNVTPEELGLNNSAEAYYATKMAIDTHLNGLDINNWTPTAGQENADAVVNAIKKVYNDGLNFDISSLPKAEFNVETVSSTKDDSNSDIVIVTMKVTTNATNYSDVSLSLSGADKPSDAKITDMSGTPKSVFKVGEEFKVTFTLPDGDYTGKTFNVDVDGTIQDYSKVLQGTPANTNHQRYAVIPQWMGSPTTGVITYDNEPEPVIDPPTGGSSKLKIKKLESGTTKGLAGAIFEVRFINNDILGTYTTDSNGEINLDVEDGNYIIEEITPPTGYVLSKQTKQEIKVDSADEVDSIVTFENLKKPSLTVKKVDGKTGLPLANATIRVALDGGANSIDVITDSTGTAKIDVLDEGTYTVTELVSPNGYLLNETPYPIKLENGKDSTITIDNFEEPSITVLKVDEATGLPLELAEFSISKKDGSIVNEGLTEKDGTFTTTGLEGGFWYTITELQAPTKYFRTQISKDVYLEKGEHLTVKFDNRLKPSLSISKIDGETGNTLAGAVFLVEKQDGSFSSEFTTDASGKILLENIDEGVYTVTEIKAPTGYAIDSTPKTIHLQWQMDNSFVHSLIFENYTKPSLIVEKYDEMTNELLPNAQFRIEGVDNNFLWEGVLSKGDLTSGATQQINGSLEDGRLVINGLDEGTYKITELNPPNGYTFSDTTVNPKTVVIEKNKTTTVKIDNRPLPDLEILKIDSVTKEPLKNATFEIRNTDGEFVTERQTDENGKINLTNIPEGTYTITEKSAPTNYILDSANTKTIQIKWNGSDNKDGQYKLIFENTLKPTLVINKTSGLGGFGLQGAKFEVKYRENDGGFKTLGTFTTNANGQIVLPYVNAGWYQITEVKAPNGYQLPSNPTKEVYLNAGENSYTDIDAPNTANDEDITVSNGNGNIKVTYGSEISEIANLFSSQDSTVYASSIDFDNYPLNSIVIKKVDALTGKLLDGATFELIKVAENVSGSQGTTIGTYTTDYTGVIVITGLTSGHYIVRESKAPLNYDMNVNNQQQAYLSEDGTSIVELMFSNYPYGKLVINKMDTDTKEPLKGATFEVTNSKGEYIGTSGNGHYTTDIEGSITLDNLPPDSYVVTEIKAPTGYTIDQENNVKVVEIGYGDTKEVDFYNQAYSSLVIRKLDTDTKEPLKGAEFKITNSDGTVVGNSNGIFTTDEDGLITITNLPLGTYVITETKAPTNYILSDNTQTVEVRGNSTHTLAFYNTKMSSAQIIKVDSVTKAPLKDAGFKVYKANGELVGTYTTDGNGLIILPHLENGWYKAIEVKAPIGYQIDDTAQDFEIKGNQFVKLTFENKKLTSLVIKKVTDTDGSPLAGAEFKVTKQNGELVGNYTTDNTGTIVIPTLTPDWYVISETKAPNGYILDETPKTVEVKTNTPTEVTFTNKLKSGLQIIKIDSVTGEPLSGATFTVYKKTGDIVGTYTTDQNGVIIVDGLSNGWYKIAETKAPIGYQIDETPKDVEMKGNEFHKIVFANTPMGGLKIIKTNSNTGEPIKGVEFEISKMNGEKVLNESNGTKFVTDSTGQIYLPNLADGTYTVTETKEADGYFIDPSPKNVIVTAGKPTILEVENTPASGLVIYKTDEKTNKPLKGVEFDVLRADGSRVTSNILDKNQPYTENNSPNKTVNGNGAVSGSYTTDENGRIYLNHLPVGEYHIVETKALDGYELDKTVHSVTVREGKQETLKITNRQKAGLRIHKIDKFTRQGIYNVEFMVFDSDNKVVGNFYSDNNGYVDFDGILSEGRYTIRETRPASGYFEDNIPKTVEFKAGQTTVIEWENTPQKGQIQIEKLSKDYNSTNGFNANTPLDGAIFDIYEYRTGNLVERVESVNGVAKSSALPLGRYKVKEVKAPDFYSLSDEIFDIDVEFAGQIVKLTAYNESVKTNVSIKKTGIKQTSVGQDIKYNITDVANNGTVALNNFYWKDFIPTNAIRTTKIVTGTYNVAQNYKIVATTNTGKEITVNDNLSTTQNYTIELNNSALGLAQNEYIVSVTLMFGVVPPNFRMVEQTSIYGTVLKTLPHDYVFTNKVEVGGTYNNNWQKSSSTWSTTVYNPSKLPKTGF